MLWVACFGANQTQRAAENSKRSPELKFRVGDIVQHKLFNYRWVYAREKRGREFK
jgi:hypothetical protein